MDNKKQLFFSILGVLLLIVTTVGISYATFNFTKTSTGANTVTSGQISMNYTEPSSTVTLSNALPTYDATGKAQSTYFEFTVTGSAALTGSATKTINYEINLTPVSVDSGKTALTNSQVMVYLTSVSGSTETAVKTSKISALTASTKRASSYVLASKSFSLSGSSSTKTAKYRVRSWVSSDVDASSWSTAGSRQYKFKINVDATAA